MIRWSLGEALRGWGFEPIEAETVSAALSAFEAESPAAVLLDINLPDGSGLDVLRKVRQQQHDAVVIMITANVLVDETIAALRFAKQINSTYSIFILIIFIFRWSAAHEAFV